ncbi:MAG: hypothetical protein VX000_06965, partial [Myxococcota bacterium]|nr:hypothetical protein [Myxococcota bacterium]
SGAFPEGALAYFDGSAAPVISNSGSNMVVTTPAGIGEGPVDVEVEHDGQRLRLDGAFTVWADGTGLAGAVGAVYWTEIVGSYWSGSTDPFGRASVYFVDPIDFHWSDLFTPTMDSCRPGAYSWGGEFEMIDPGLTNIELRGTSGAFQLGWDASEEGFLLEDLDENLWDENAGYDLVAPSSGSLPRLGVNDLLRTGEAPVLYEPDISGSTPPYIEEDPVFEWAPTGADWIEIRLALWDSGRTGYQENMYCVVNDDGYYRVDTGQLSEWPDGRQVDVYFASVVEPSAVLPWNGADSRVVGGAGIFGAGFAED